MISRIISKLKLYKKNIQIQKLKSRGNLSVGIKSNVEGASFDLRNTKQDISNIEVGDGCLISGSYVCELATAKIIIGDNTFIGGGRFIATTEINIGSDVMFSWGCTVIDSNAHSLYWRNRLDDVKDWKRGIDHNAIGVYKDWSKVDSKKIVIEDNVWIGFDCIILKGVTIGKGAIVAAGSVVTKSVESFTLVGGNPAVKIKDLVQ
jgi:acetyltransferase-like isoleucine patch superfamily enzyme